MRHEEEDADGGARSLQFRALRLGCYGLLVALESSYVHAGKFVEGNIITC